MTDNNHPITPPPELVERWRDEALNSFPDDENPCPCDIDDARDEYIATQAARWGADQELEACCEWLFENGYKGIPMSLRAFRRPKPKSQVEEALDLLDRIEYNHMTKNLGNEKAWDIKELESVRAALERLRELEKSNG